ncbi:hypothetical protein RvY_03667 [Ramazzottius varieornatus]|uniref:SCP domain-containing protein n=1 Tax=Ramazzottius varieornatus TaxID=947166 RepID=A0A1D1UNV5_RAMVA|nr:hypothetical protein RvY_03667 [Ramazzottius varieornatus]
MRVAGNKEVRTAPENRMNERQIVVTSMQVPLIRCRPEVFPNLLIAGFCSDTANLNFLCDDLEISSAGSGCAQLEGNFCCYISLAQGNSLTVTTTGAPSRVTSTQVAPSTNPPTTACSHPSVPTPTGDHNPTIHTTANNYHHVAPTDDAQFEHPTTTTPITTTTTTIITITTTTPTTTPTPTSRPTTTTTTTARVTTTPGITTTTPISPQCVSQLNTSCPNTQQVILNAMNTVRRQQGSADILQMVWDTVAAHAAQAWAEGCWFQQ